jgi:DNA-binding beta-propeller fold protein YncE
MPDSDMETGPRAFPELAISDQQLIRFVRVFSADRDVERRKLNSLVDAAVGSPDEVERDKARTPQTDEGSALELHRGEVVTDSGHGASHAVRAIRERSTLGEFADAIVGLAPSRDLRMSQPHRVAIDSKQRIIVTDPPAHSLHVFDFAKKKYFRIQGGDGRRLQSPTGVAVDDEDNIYVSDAASGMVLVYDSQGRFLRALGEHDGEGFLDQPDGIAIDANTGNIYVSDSPHHLIYVFDREGQTRSRFAVGSKPSGFGRRGTDGTTDIVIKQNRLILADGNSCMLEFFDLQGHLQQQFEVFDHSCGLEPKKVSLDVDAAGDIYVSDGALNTVHVYDHNGDFLYAFGSKGTARGEFLSPSGVRIDAKGRIYVADSNNHRIQVFEIRATPKREHHDYPLDERLERRAKRRADNDAAKTATN